MRKCQFGALLLSLGLAAALCAQETKPGVPVEKDLFAANKKIREANKELIAKRDAAKATAADQLAVAQAFFDQAATIKDDPAARYLLLREARDTAANAGSIHQSFLACDALTEQFNIAPLDAQKAAFDLLARHVTSPAQAADLLNLCRTLIERAADAGKYDMANQLYNLIGPIAARSGDAGVMQGSRNLQRHMATLAAAATNNARAESDLKAAPNDPTKNYTVGHYYAFVRGDFVAASKYLSRSNDETLRQMALLEKSEIRDNKGTLQLADSWWQQGDNRQEPAKTLAHVHAAELYKTIAGGFDDQTNTRMRIRIENAANETFDVHAKTIDLITLLTPSSKIAAGKWGFDKDGQLVSVGEGRDAIAFPYTPPPEFDLTVEFTRVAGDEDVCLIFTVNTWMFMLVMGAQHNQLFGIEAIEGRVLAKEPTAVKADNIAPAKTKNSVVVQMRQGAFDAVLNGKQKYHMITDFKNWFVAEPWQKSCKGIKIGVATQNSSVIFHTAKLVEISGQGKKD